MSQDTFEVTLEQRGGYQFAVDFQRDHLPKLVMDEPAPLGEGAGPNAARVLAAAIGHCLSASALFCLTKARVTVEEMRTVVSGTIVREERGRLRIGELSVRLYPRVAPEDKERVGRCLEIFEDFCIVTQSVRRGIDVQVSVEPADAGVEQPR
jgi:organic hydroperoxide reductase OsmC/OhrA